MLKCTSIAQNDFLKVTPSTISKRTGLCPLHLPCSSSVRDCKSGVFKYQQKKDLCTQI